MARMIKFRAQCFYCLKWKEKGEAFLQRDFKNFRWQCHCRDCYNLKKEKEAEMLARIKAAEGNQ